MSHAGPCSATPGEETVLVRFGRFLNAVGVEDDRTGELGQFLGLILPGPAKVACQVSVLLQARIAVGGQHLAMGIDVNAFALGLLEQFFEHFQVVTRDQDSFAGLGAGINRGRHRMAVIIDMALIEQSHHRQVVLSALHGQVDEIHQAEIGVTGGKECFFDKCCYFRISLAENAGVVGVGGHALETINENFYHRADVSIAVQLFDAELFALGYQVGCRNPGRSAFFKGWRLNAINLAESVFIEVLSFIFKLTALTNNISQAGSIEIDVGHRGK